MSRWLISLAVSMKKFQPNRNDKLVFSFNLFLILFCLQDESAKCHVTEFRNVWLALLKWLGFCLGTKKDVAKMIKKSRATHNVVAAWHTEAEKSTHIIDVCARFTFFTHVSTEERKVFVLDRRGTMEARTSEEKKRALTACLARLEKRLRQSSWGEQVFPSSHPKILKNNGK